HSPMDYPTHQKPFLKWFERPLYYQTVITGTTVPAASSSYYKTTVGTNAPGRQRAVGGYERAVGGNQRRACSVFSSASLRERETSRSTPSAMTPVPPSPRTYLSMEL